MAMRGVEMMAPRLVRASVKTSDVQLVSKYSSCSLYICSQHPFFSKLRSPDDQKKKTPAVFPHRFPPCNVTLAISKVTHTTAAIKALLTATLDFAS